jgi:hypothetical protein
MGTVTGNGADGLPGVTGGGTGGSTGVLGISDSGFGVSGVSTAATNGIGVNGSCEGGTGVQGTSVSSRGVYATSQTGDGMHGVNGVGSGTTPKFGCGVRGDSANGYGLYGASKTASGVYGTSGPGHFAGEFAGDVSVTGDITAKDITATGDITAKTVTASGNITAADVILSGADCAEEFDIVNAVELEPGTVVVFDGTGAISQSILPYNKRVAGVISGAGNYRPGVVLGRSGSSGQGKAPVALVGRVYCKVDASYSPIEVGDMLTTSATSGFAMRASDPSMAFGAVIGKALAGLDRGCGLIPILVTLQ